MRRGRLRRTLFWSALLLGLTLLALAGFVVRAVEALASAAPRRRDTCVSAPFVA